MRRRPRPFPSGTSLLWTAMTAALAASSLARAGTPISFQKSVLTGVSLSNPTSLQFGPDARLYVSQQNGLLLALDVVRNGPNSYAVVQSEQISLVKEIANHDDDGSLNGTENARLVTGILVTGTASNPVIYVPSSDPRIGGGGSGTDLNLDTNSGILSRLTWNGTSWTKHDVLRGLPRSEENHASNGMHLDTSTNTLYLAQGGHTNQGATSNNFALLPEFALSAAILAIDLDAIGETTHDLPTLDDEDRAGDPDLNDPFGGNNGKNQAKLDPNGPLRIHSPGWRNIYDLVVTASGRMYTIDNGPNAGWGDVPVGCSNDVNEPGQTHPDNLHFVSGAGYYGGHPNPTRADTSNTFNASNPQSPVATMNPVECDYLVPGVGDGALATFPASTNGLSEYTSSAFAFAMRGNLIAASFDNSIKRVVLNAAGDQAVLVENLFSSVGSRPLDVTCRADSDSFPGTIWVADHGANDIFVFEPEGAVGCTGADDPGVDEDGDGYTNADEIDNGTDPCSPADVPPDLDGDFVSNLNDPDDDGDGEPDTSDVFAADPFDGRASALPLDLSWENDAPNPGGLLSLGFTGLMTNGTDDYETLFDPSRMTTGGAAGVVTVDAVPAGDARDRTQSYAFQVGLDVGVGSRPFTIQSRIVGPFAGITPEPEQSMGLHFGRGTQDAYIKVVVAAVAPGTTGVVVAGAPFGVYASGVVSPLAMPGPDHVDLFLAVDPGAATVRASYEATTGGVPGGRVFLEPEVPFPAAWLAGPAAPAAGIIATSRGATPFPASWDFLTAAVDSAEAATPAAEITITPSGGINASTFSNGSFQITNTSTAGERIAAVSVDLSSSIFPDMVFDPDGTAGDVVAKCFQANSNGSAVGLVAPADPCADPFSGPHDDGWDVLSLSFTDFDPGETFTFSVDVDPTSIRGTSAPGPNESGSVSGVELTASAITFTFDDASVRIAEPFRVPASLSGSRGYAGSALPPRPALEIVGLETPDEAAAAQQTVRIGGPAGHDVRVLVVEGGLYTAGLPGGGFDLDPFEANSAIRIEQHDTRLEGATFVDVPITLARTDPEAGIHHIVAALIDSAGRTGPLSRVRVVELVTGTAVPPLADPDSVALGIVAVGDTAHADVMVTHAGPPGDVPLTLGSASIVGDTQFTTTDVSGTVLDPGASVVLSLSFAPNTSGATGAALSIDHDGAGAPLVVSLSGVGTGGPGLEWRFRVNTGGPAVTALDSGPDWMLDTEASPSPYVNALAAGNQTFSIGGAIDTSHPSVPMGTPASIFQSERWDPSGGEEMTWRFPVEPGEYVVRLHFAEIWSGAKGTDLRVFHVAVEDSTVLDSLDVYDTVGGDTALTTVHAVTSDDTLEIALTRAIQNPAIKGIEILAALDNGDLIAGSPPVEISCEGDSVTATVRLAVIGSDGFTVAHTRTDVYLDEILPANLIAAFVDSSMVEGQTNAHRFTLPDSARSGRLIMLVDAGDDVAESNEANNVASAAFDCDAVGAPEPVVAVYRLSQNVPNPFRPRTTIRFSLAGPGATRLFIFDVSGRLVRRLVDAHLAGGPHRYEWNGRDARGRAVAPGVYFYRLRSGSYSGIRSMLLLK